MRAKFVIVVFAAIGAFGAFTVTTPVTDRALVAGSDLSWAAGNSTSLGQVPVDRDSDDGDDGDDSQCVLDEVLVAVCVDL